MRRMTIAAAAMAVLSVTPVAAQTANPVPIVTAAAGGSVETATKLIAALQLRGTFDRTFQQLTPLISNGVIASIQRASDAPADLKAKIENPASRQQVEKILGEEIMKSYRARYAQIIDATAKRYAATFSEADLKAALAFYQTPVGQRFIAAQSTLQAELGEQGRAIGAEAGREAIPIAIKRIMGTAPAVPAPAPAAKP
ncbi:DUF2059 domain-containing protein [Sphingomonas sp. CA1-15]|uniref:DUF2059 domain-containing protein n=2 Tax=Sphingomonas immobilis TaxID=3063997 RepID=A0ABT8ZUQ2_9SPHN|nr:DUF2059 domain-containing protein [Sphingomonas sp. CA1-15]